jgi:hypothetical protein
VDDSQQQDEISELNLMTMRHFEIVNGQSANLVTFRGSIQGSQALILIDSGASHDYLSLDFAKSHNLVSAGKTSKVALANGSLVDTPSFVKIAGPNTGLHRFN